MKWYKYSHGIWEEVNNPLVEEDDDWDKCLKLAGYELSGYVGGNPEFAANIEVWSARKDTVVTEQYSYILSVSVVGSCFFPVLIPDNPSLLIFMRDFAPAIQKQRSLDFQDVVERAIERGFEVWHGHDLHDDCAECDATAVAMREHRKREAKALLNQ